MNEWKKHKFLVLSIEARFRDCLISKSAQVDADFNFDKYNDEIRSAINSRKYILVKEPLRKAIPVSNPQAPRLCGFPKIHKDGSPMRPVISFVSAPSYKLAKYLDIWFKQLIDFRLPFL